MLITDSMNNNHNIHLYSLQILIASIQWWVIQKRQNKKH